MATGFWLLFAALIQSPTARVRGQVLDPSHAVVAGAQVIVADSAGQIHQTSTDRQGAYSFDRLAAGPYTLTASAPGFDDRQQVVELTAGQDAVVDLTLQIAVQRQSILVEGSAIASTNPAANANAMVLKGQDLDALSDDPDELEVQLHALAGASAGPTGAHIYVDGFSGGKLPPKQAIAEIRVNQDPYSAEYDTPGSARIEIITKPGGASLHGRFLADGNLAAMNARDPFLAQKPASESAALTGTMDGPVGKKASFFLFGDSIDLRSRTAINAVALDPGFSPVAVHESLATSHSVVEASPRLDGQLSPHDTASIRYQLYRLTDANTAVGQLSLPAQALDQRKTEHDVQATDLHVLSTRTVVDFRAEYSDTLSTQTPVARSPQISVIGAFTDGGNASGDDRAAQHHAELHETLTTTRGSHLIKAGGDVRVTIASDRSRQNFNGTFTFPSLDVFRRTETGLEQGASQFSITFGQPEVSETMADAGAFVQDDWRVTDRITIGAGLRYEWQNGIPTRGDLGPRGSLAWAVGRPNQAGARPWVLRSGAGFFYDRVPQSVFLEALRLDGLRTRQYVVASPNFYPLVPAEAALASALVQPTVYRIEPRIASPVQFQTGLTAERRLGRSSTFAVGYLYSAGSRELYSENVRASETGGAPQAPLYGFTSGGRFNQHELTANVNIRSLGWATLTGAYVLSSARGDTNGPTSFPSNPFDLEADYGRTTFDVRQRLTLFMGIDGPGFRLVPSISASSGQPFDITVGQDLNGDSIFNDRPAFATDLSRASVVMTPLGAFDTAPIPGQRIIPRNFGSGAAQIALNLRAMKPFVVRQHDTIRVDLLAGNLLNRINAAVPVGSLSSLYFDHSLALASPPRGFRVQLQFIF